MNKVLTGAAILVLIILIALSMNKPQQPTAPRDPSTIRYIAIGDSYTIGHGVLEYERWPDILAENLRREGVNIELTANPSVSGYTVQDALQYEVPVLAMGVDFVTILIGANDSFGMRPPQTFEKELNDLIEQTQKYLSDKNNLLLVTIPDYSISPQGKAYGENQYADIIKQYNAVIKKVAAARKLPVADIYPVSREVAEKEGAFTEDGLHPGLVQYQAWEEVIRKKALEILKEDR